MKKKVMAGALAVMLVASSTVFAGSTSKNIKVDANLMKVNVNGVSVTADNFLYNGTTYLPVRAVTEAMGAKVDFDQATMTATITSNTSSDKKIATAANVYYNIEGLGSMVDSLINEVNYVIYSEDKTEYTSNLKEFNDDVATWKKELADQKSSIESYKAKDSYYKDAVTKAESIFEKYDALSSEFDALPDVITKYYNSKTEDNAKGLVKALNAISSKSTDCYNTASAQYDYYMSQITE